MPSVAITRDCGGTPIHGRLVYVVDDHAFDFFPQDGNPNAGSGRVASLAIDTLQLEVSVESGQLLYAWGYCPQEGWGRASAPPNDWVARALAVSGCELEPGVAIEVELSHQGKWFDETTGWFWIGPRQLPTGGQLVMFADSCIAVLDGSQFLALLLQPENWSELRLP